MLSRTNQFNKVSIAEGDYAYFARAAELPMGSSFGAVVLHQQFGVII